MRHRRPGKSYTICAICEIAYEDHNIIKVKDRYNRHYGLSVCKWDFDKTNAQDLPFRVSDNIKQREQIRASLNPTLFVVADPDDEVPSAPRNPYTLANSLDNSVDLYWDAPLDSGTSPITHYIITRIASADPGPIEVQTDNSALHYLDIDATVDETITYVIYAVNGAGTGAASTSFYWPSSYAGATYLSDSQNDYYLTTSSGVFIEL